MIADEGGFIAFVPYAAEVPFEIWIVPQRHRAAFGGLGEIECAGFAAILDQVLRLYRDRLGDPPYNFVIIGATHGNQDLDDFHWYLRLCPRSTIPGGLEMGTGLCVNPSLPKRDAALLRGDST